jgi:hypothetical protein
VTCFELESNSGDSQVVGIPGIPGGTGISGMGTRVDALRSDKEVCLSWNLRCTNTRCNIKP